jgi:hypothetical protein
MPFAERYARECDSVLAGTPYRAAANDGAARKRPPIKMIPTAITADRKKPMFVAIYLLLVAPLADLHPWNRQGGCNPFHTKNLRPRGIHWRGDLAPQAG